MTSYDYIFMSDDLDEPGPAAAPRMLLVSPADRPGRPACGQVQSGLRQASGPGFSSLTNLQLKLLMTHGSAAV
jgi:hypothetical protein